MRVSVLTADTLGLAALVTFLAGCSSGISQTPAPSSPANSLAQAITQRAAGLRPVAPNLSPGFMQKTDAKTNLVYMSSWGSESVVDVLTPNGREVGQITNGLLAPEGLFVDSKSNLWVANLINILVFPHGGLTASSTLTDPTGDPIDVTVCPDGTVYAADSYDTSNGNHSSIQIYAAGSTTPTGNLDYASDFRNPFLTCDAKGNVFAAISTGEYVGDGRVIEFPLGKEPAVDLGIALQSPGGIKPDNAGNLLVTDLVAHTITEYTVSGAPTGVSFATGDPILGIALSRNGRTVLGADPNPPDGVTWSFPAGKQEHIYTCCARIGPPIQANFGVAFYPGQKGI